MSCGVCRDIGDFKTIQYNYPDEFCPDGSFCLHNGDSYYDIPNVEYCPYCGSKLIPPKVTRKTPDNSPACPYSPCPLGTREALEEALKQWTSTHPPDECRHFYCKKKGFET